MRVVLSLILLCCSQLICAEEAKPTLAERIAAAATEHQLPLVQTEGQFSGPGWDWLLSEGRQAQFFLLGEEHGIAENPQFAGALFAELTGSGYEHLAIEISPPMAAALDQAAASGFDSLKTLLSTPGSAPAFFGMAEEAQMLAAVRAAVPQVDQVFWGLDYEVLADRHLLQQLDAMDKPDAAQAALQVLTEASTAAWQRHSETGGPQHIFSFGGDPALVQTLREAWPDAPAQAAQIIHTLEETLKINQLWVSGQGWASNQRRAKLNRANFLDYWRAQKAAGRSPRVMAKMGGSHMVRGRSMTEVFDLGSLMSETAALEGGHSFHLLVLPGEGAEVANFDPTKLRFHPAPAKDGYAGGLDSILNAAAADQFTVFDLRPLRPLLGRWREGTAPELMRVVHGFDALLLMNGSTASTDLAALIESP